MHGAVLFGGAGILRRWREGSSLRLRSKTAPVPSWGLDAFSRISLGPTAACVGVPSHQNVYSKRKSPWSLSTSRWLRTPLLWNARTCRVPASVSIGS